MKTVADLIDILAGCNQEAEVLISGGRDETPLVNWEVGDRGEIILIGE